MATGRFSLKSTRFNQRWLLVFGGKRRIEREREKMVAQKQHFLETADSPACGFAGKITGSQRDIRAAPSLAQRAKLSSSIRGCYRKGQVRRRRAKILYARATPLALCKFLSGMKR